MLIGKLSAQENLRKKSWKEVLQKWDLILSLPSLQKSEFFAPSFGEEEDIDRARKPKQRLIVGEKKKKMGSEVIWAERDQFQGKESLDDVSSRQEEKRFLVPKMWNPRRYFRFLLEERGGALNSISRPFLPRTFFPFCAKTRFPSLSLFLSLQYFSPIGHGSGAAEEEQKRFFLPPESKFHLHPTRFSPSLHSLVGGPPRLLGKYRLSKIFPK